MLPGFNRKSHAFYLFSSLRDSGRVSIGVSFKPRVRAIVIDSLADMDLCPIEKLKDFLIAALYLGKATFVKAKIKDILEEINLSIL